MDQRQDRAAPGAPSLVGEILVGVILGPHVVDFVPFPSALKSIGEVGLCLHALEAGLMVDVEMLEIVGARGPPWALWVLPHLSV